MSDECEAVVVGTGFGGGISACRLAKKWPGRVVVLERGKRYGLGQFPRSPDDFRKNFWVLPDHTPHPRHVRRAAQKNGELHGMYDVRNYEHMDVVVCAGVGGGSLIYANVFLIPPDGVFVDNRWPDSCKKADLLPYYGVAKSVLGSRPIPPHTDDPRRRIPKTELFQRIAREARHDSQLVDINVFFGRYPQQPNQPPLEIGRQEENRYGAVQTSCTYCGECICGCNYHAKNTVDLNYLHAAENFHLAEVRTECLVEEIVPVDANGADRPEADGADGYRVKYRDLKDGTKKTVLTKRVVVSAGCLGSTELLLRCKKILKSLHRISDHLGQQFSGNGDFLSFVIEGFAGHSNYGPTITQETDYNLFKNFMRDRAFILEDASYPAFLAWFVEGVRPRGMWLAPVARFVRHLIANFTSGKSPGTLGYAFADLLGASTSAETAVLLCMGVDTSDGVMDLDANGHLSIQWPWQRNRILYDAICNAGEEFKRLAPAKCFSALPTWDWPIRNNVTVHPLGGCVLADSAERGVTSADRSDERNRPDGTTFGHVFGYKNLYVADGAIVPTSTGSNPIATISALSEMVARGITGLEPDPGGELR
jgi:cholesterol oxidase